jgi:hypothetical protein
MPYAVFFDLKGHAFHGSYQKTFGKAVSHGCVRLPVKDAKRLFEAVKVSGAEVEITGKAPSVGVDVIAREDASEAANGFGGPQQNNVGQQLNSFWGHASATPAPLAPANAPRQGFSGIFGGDTP